MKIYFCDVCKRQLDPGEERGHEISIGFARFVDVCQPCTSSVDRLKLLVGDAAEAWARERRK
jgi:hypothetical protein